MHQGCDDIVGVLVKVNKGPVRFRLLGPVSMLSGRHEVGIGYPKQRCVLAVLLITANQSVSTTALIDRVWGGAPPSTARSSLYTYVAQLRAVLASQSIPLIKNSNGYVVEVDPESIDLHQFRRLTGKAVTDDISAAAHALNEAVALCASVPFGDLSTPWLDAMRAAVLAERRSALLRRNHLLLSLGRPTEVLPELHCATADSPLDESLAAQLITALCQTGQRAGALEHYHRVRGVLAEELGIDPGPSLQRLYHQILDNVPDLGLRQTASPRSCQATAPAPCRAAP